MIKGLEALEPIKKMFCPHWSLENYELIEKELKALEIIKKKCEIFFQVIEEQNIYRITIKRKNSKIVNYGCVFEISQEEYNSLKEVCL